jgi:hypothetical protein
MPKMVLVVADDELGRLAGGKSQGMRGGRLIAPGR